MQTYNPKDLTLFSLCKAFFRKALDALEQYLKTGGHIPLITYYEPVIHLDENGKSKGIEYVPYEDKDFRFLGVKYYQELLDLPEMKTACSYISEKKYLLIGEDNFAPYVLLYDALKDFFKSTNSLSYQEKGFLDTYIKIEDLIFNDQMLFRSMAKLTNFSSSNTQIKFDNMHYIKTYKQDECKELYHHPSINIYDHNLPHPGDFKIEVLKSKDKNSWGKAGIESTEEIKQILTTLRLFKDAAVGIAFLEMNKPITWFPFTSKAIQLLPPHPTGDLCSIGEDEIPGLIEVWGLVKDIDYKNCPSLEIAIKRFNDGHEHREREDALIDIFIGLEALYTIEVDELRFKLALRAATFLEASIPEHMGKKKEIFDAIYEGYKLRSNVVHGKKVSGAKLWEYRFVGRYLADSIRQFAHLSQRYPNKYILNTIDECIKSNSKENLLALFS